MPVTISSDVSLQGREYERTNTTAVNAYLAPVVGTYLRTLAGRLPELGIDAPLWIMQSSGGLAPAGRAADLPVRTIESGPAAGALVSAHHGQLAGHADVISLDMGGTTAKAAVIRDGRPGDDASVRARAAGATARERAAARHPGNRPGRDQRRRRLDRARAVRDPAGRAAQRRRRPGARLLRARRHAPTVTDANLLLGYLNADYFAGGAMTLDRDAAERAVDGLARALELPRLRTAWGIHEVVSLEMERAIRLVSIDRGLDPRDFALIAIGGAAPAHGCRLARMLGVRRVVVPRPPGSGSALGLLEGNETFELARTALLRLDRHDAAERVDAIFALAGAGGARHGRRVRAAAGPRDPAHRGPCATPGRATSSRCGSTAAASRGWPPRSTTSTSGRTAIASSFPSRR